MNLKESTALIGQRLQEQITQITEGTNRQLTVCRHEDGILILEKTQISARRWHDDRIFVTLRELRYLATLYPLPEPLPDAPPTSG